MAVMVHPLDLYLDDVLNDTMSYTTVMTFTEEMLPVLEDTDNKKFLGWYDANGNQAIVGNVISTTVNVIDSVASSSNYKLYLYSKYEETYSYVDESSGKYKPRIYNNNVDLQKIFDMISALGLVDIPMITFYINGVSNQAEEGMTWEEWCKSEYNIHGYFTVNGNVKYNGSTVSSEDTIIDGNSYTHDTVSIGGGSDD